MHILRRPLSLLLICAAFTLIPHELVSSAKSDEPVKPNILWLSTEDIGPQLGCYGDPDAVTPNLDQFAKNSLVYDIAWSNYPVCAPARTTIIGGVYACALAAGNMRSMADLPESMDMFPHFLRAKGYYCTNNNKTDYNIRKKSTQPWDESSKKAHWKNRKPDQPFFAVFNHTGTHESKIRVRPHEAKIDPNSVTLPPYWPDVPEVRQDWAQYHDNITRMDSWFQEKLDELEAAGLADNTIVVFFGDHGSGMPRHKRSGGNTGMHVPFIVHVPEKLKALAPASYAAGARTNRPVGFVDLAPTMLSVAGIQPPKYMQGHAFMGEFKTPDPQYCYGFRDRMDERPDLSRSIRDQKFIYVRNYMPHLPAGQHVRYQFVTPTTSIWKQMFDDGKLNEIQSHFWMPHPPEELYDLDADPHETRNLVDNEEYQEVLARFRKEHRENMFRFKDLGLIPESIAFRFGKNQTRWLINEDKNQFPLDEIFKMADRAAQFDEASVPTLVQGLDHESATLRYWSALGLLIRGTSAVEPNLERLEKIATEDAAPIVQIVAAEACCTSGNETSKRKGLESLIRNAEMTTSDFYASIHALNALDRVGVDAKQVQQLTRKPKEVSRGNGYVADLIDGLGESR